ncbi:MAG TPA: TolC family protein [Gemmataceae bacterium]|nr:TolC family protein [Gemmataceae bacterium]
MPRRGFIAAVLLAGLTLLWAAAQQQPPKADAPLTLEDAIQLAQANEPAFAAAAAESRATALERKDAKAALLPSVTFHNQYLFTESNHTPAITTQGATGQSLPVFIANNAIHEYTNQAAVTETIGLAGTAAVRLASANAARAQAELEIARRGLVSTVVELYYNIRAGADKLAVAQRALDEADRFVDVTQKREEGREAAHSDVIKARLGQQQRQRELAEAGLANEKANLELGILLFPDPSRKFALAVETAPPVLPDRPSVEAAARANNPEVRSALATLQAGQATTLSAWAGLMPDLALNFNYGIDAPQFAGMGPDGARNLGYSASATVDVPIWDWLTSERKVKEARIRAQASKVALSAAQRRLLADLTEFYNEAEIARQELASLDASVADAREALRLTNLRYVNGESTVLDVVDAQNTLVTAESGQVDGLVRYHLALAQLETLTGRL